MELLRLVMDLLYGMEASPAPGSSTRSELFPVRPWRLLSVTVF